MSTKTRRENMNQSERWILKLTPLFTTAITLIQRRVRSANMIYALLQAFQLFKENRLAGVVALEKNHKESLPFNLQELLSMRIQDLNLSKSTKRYYESHGVWYVGEVYNFFDRTRSGLSKVGAFQQMENYLSFLGLPGELDPIAAGWEPPYWNDTRVQEALNTPIIAQCTHYPEMHHRRGIHYFGQIIQKRGGHYRDTKRKHHYLYKWAQDEGLHGAMYLPYGWTAPGEVPEAWTNYLQKMHEE